MYRSSILLAAYTATMVGCGQSTRQSTPTAIVVENGIEINGTRLFYPIAVSELDKVLIGPRRMTRSSDYHVWDKYGIAAHTKPDSASVLFVVFQLADGATAEVDPWHAFSGTVQIGTHRFDSHSTVGDLKRQGLTQDAFPSVDMPMWYTFRYLGWVIALTPESTTGWGTDGKNTDDAKIISVAVEREMPPMTSDD